MSLSKYYKDRYNDVLDKYGINKDLTLRKGGRLDRLENRAYKLDENANKTGLISGLSSIASAVTGVVGVASAFLSAGASDYATEFHTVDTANPKMYIIAAANLCIALGAGYIADKFYNKSKGYEHKLEETEERIEGIRGEVVAAQEKMESAIDLESVICGGPDIKVPKYDTYQPYQFAGNNNLGSNNPATETVFPVENIIKLPTQDAGQE